ncbi:unnamed protein product [Amoebophrya sp. A25]|nr:unnamed protein product [Amoebophrya sp. A25]|eukprot:GSA25T00012636001.1
MNKIAAIFRQRVFARKKMSSSHEYENMLARKMLIVRFAFHLLAVAESVIIRGIEDGGLGRPGSSDADMLPAEHPREQAAADLHHADAAALTSPPFGSGSSSSSSGVNVRNLLNPTSSSMSMSEDSESKLHDRKRKSNFPPARIRDAFMDETEGEQDKVAALAEEMQERLTLITQQEGRSASDKGQNASGATSRKTPATNCNTFPKRSSSFEDFFGVVMDFLLKRSAELFRAKDFQLQVSEEQVQELEQRLRKLHCAFYLNFVQNFLSLRTRETPWDTERRTERAIEDILSSSLPDFFRRDTLELRNPLMMMKHLHWDELDSIVIFALLKNDIETSVENKRQLTCRDAIIPRAQDKDGAALLLSMGGEQALYRLVALCMRSDETVRKWTNFLVHDTHLDKPVPPQEFWRRLGSIHVALSKHKDHTSVEESRIDRDMETIKNAGYGEGLCQAVEIGLVTYDLPNKEVGIVSDLRRHRRLLGQMGSSAASRDQESRRRVVTRSFPLLSPATAAFEKFLEKTLQKVICEEFLPREGHRDHDLQERYLRYKEGLQAVDRVRLGLKYRASAEEGGGEIQGFGKWRTFDSLERCLIVNALAEEQKELAAFLPKDLGSQVEAPDLVTTLEIKDWLVGKLSSAPEKESSSWSLCLDVCFGSELKGKTTTSGSSGPDGGGKKRTDPGGGGPGPGSGGPSDDGGSARKGRRQKDHGRSEASGAQRDPGSSSSGGQAEHGKQTRSCPMEQIYVIEYLEEGAEVPSRPLRPLLRIEDIDGDGGDGDDSSCRKDGDGGGGDDSSCKDIKRAYYTLWPPYAGGQVEDDLAYISTPTRPATKKRGKNSTHEMPPAAAMQISEEEPLREAFSGKAAEPNYADDEFRTLLSLANRIFTDILSCRSGKPAIVDEKKPLVETPETTGEPTEAPQETQKASKGGPEAYHGDAPPGTSFDIAAGTAGSSRMQEGTGAPLSASESDEREADPDGVGVGALSEPPTSVEYDDVPDPDCSGRLQDFDSEDEAGAPQEQEAGDGDGDRPHDPDNDPQGGAGRHRTWVGQVRAMMFPGKKSAQQRGGTEGQGQAAADRRAATPFQTDVCMDMDDEKAAQLQGYLFRADKTWRDAWRSHMTVGSEVNRYRSKIIQDYYAAGRRNGKLYEELVVKEMYNFGCAFQYRNQEALRLMAARSDQRLGGGTGDPTFLPQAGTKIDHFDITAENLVYTDPEYSSFCKEEYGDELLHEDIRQLVQWSVHRLREGKARRDANRSCFGYKMTLSLRTLSLRQKADLLSWIINFLGAFAFAVWISLVEVPPTPSDWLWLLPDRLLLLSDWWTGYWELEDMSMRGALTDKEELERRFLAKRIGKLLSSEELDFDSYEQRIAVVEFLGGTSIASKEYAAAAAKGNNHVYALFLQWERDRTCARHEHDGERYRVEPSGPSILPPSGEDGKDQTYFDVDEEVVGKAKQTEYFDVMEDAPAAPDQDHEQMCPAADEISRGDEETAGTQTPFIEDVAVAKATTSRTNPRSV